jgi:serine/threonine protein kinase/Flp pilus assembly protein TadD
MSNECDDDPLLELLARWDELHRQGKDVPAEELCAGCPELAAELDRRIGILRALDGPLDTMTVECPSLRIENARGSTERGAEPASGSAGAQAARYRRLWLHARGGLGEVFVAHDEELNRQVALKEIQGRLARDPYSRSRFLVEAGVTAGLEHPGIVPVHGLGQYPDGRPYYAMRLIRGESLKVAIAQFHGAFHASAASAERTRALQKLLRRFLDACNTMAYAHSRGAIHRDLKPSNIMLGKFGETLIVDWGLAKCLGRSGAETCPSEGPLPPPSTVGVTTTRPGGVSGTPAYMSPEQARGDHESLGPATDIYSLGATLYCILTGRAPFEDDGPLAVLGKVKQGAFPSPRKVDPAVPHGLEAICLKAMALRPEDRYVSVRDLADDIESWMADAPVSALPEGWPSRLARRARRHQTWVKAGTAALLMVTMVSVVAAFRIQAALTKAEANAREASLHRQRAARNFGDIVAGMGEVAKYLMDRSRGSTPEAKAIRQDAVRRIDLFMRNWMDRQGKDPTLQPEGIKARHTHAYLLTLLGDTEAAERERRIAIEETERLVSLHPTDPGFRLELGQAYEAEGSRSWSSNHSTSSQCFRKATEQFIHAARLAPNNPVILNQGAWFLVICPDPDFRDYDRAISWATKALSVAELPDQGRTWNTIGVARYRKGDWSGAITALTKAVELRVGGPNDSDCFVLAMAHWQRGDRNQANTWYGRAIAWLDRRAPLAREASIFYAEASSRLGRRD